MLSISPSTLPLMFLTGAAGSLSVSSGNLRIFSSAIYLPNLSKGSWRGESERREKRFDRADALNRTLDLQKMRRARNRFVWKSKLLGHRASDQRRRHHLVERRISANEFHRRRAMRHLRPQIGIRATGENVRLVFARTRENPVAARAIVPQRRARHQLVSVRHPPLEAPAELLRQLHRILVALGTTRRARGERFLVGLLQVLNWMAGARIHRRIEQH